MQGFFIARQDGGKGIRRGNGGRNSRTVGPGETKTRPSAVNRPSLSRSDPPPCAGSYGSPMVAVQALKFMLGFEVRGMSPTALRGMCSALWRCCSAHLLQAARDCQVPSICHGSLPAPIDCFQSPETTLLRSTVLSGLPPTNGCSRCIGFRYKTFYRKEFIMKSSLLAASRNAKTITPVFHAATKIFVQKVRFFNGGHFIVINGTSLDGVPIKSFCDAIEGTLSEFGILLNPTAPRNGDTIGNADAFVFLSQSDFEAELKASAETAATSTKAAQAEPAVDF